MDGYILDWKHEAASASLYLQNFTSILLHENSIVVFNNAS